MITCMHAANTSHCEQNLIINQPILLVTHPVAILHDIAQAVCQLTSGMVILMELLVHK